MVIKHSAVVAPNDIVASAGWNANHTGSLNHGTELTNVTTDQHHPQIHDAASHSDIASTGANIDDAVTKKHTAGTDPNDHAESHNIASHSDTTATGTELNTLTDNSVANTLHRHSELVASDGAPDPAVSVDATGNVGIGTTAPGTLLDISAAVPILRITDTTTGKHDYGEVFGTLQWYSPDTINTPGIQAYIRAAHLRTGTGHTYADAGLEFGVGNTAVASTKMVLTNTGNVGIGTTTPNAKLHVVGLPIYANNAAAITGGLTAGAFYRTGADPDPVCVVH